jgi:hypothetical protein
MRRKGEGSVTAACAAHDADGGTSRDSEREAFEYRSEMSAVSGCHVLEAQLRGGKVRPTVWRCRTALVHCRRLSLRGITDDSIT